MAALNPIFAANARLARVTTARAAVVRAACRYRAAFAAWEMADDRLDDLKGPTTPAEKRAWERANDIATAAEHRVGATEKALFRAVDRLAKAEGR